ncbi:methyltransferase family protein [Amycolatopsis anabasis]|uniref:methyltransferase family protein n=1 Tax=Amycolatopsis anabasis TaxID=1840409 RepID=UPI00131B6D50|nr:isoprenylcysteine carboxylmethyltransferase family protein [Amycolatopsis anabasis]
MAVLALVLYLVYLFAAFGLRSWLQWRRTGSTGIRRLGGRVGSLEWSGGALFLLALALGLAGPVLQLVGVLAPVAMLNHTVVQGAGAALAVAGIAGTLAAQQAMGASWRVGVDRAETTELVTGGLFARVRNPIFTAMITAALGLTLLAPNPVALIGLVALVTAVEIQVRAVEEPYLRRHHGDAYQRYASRAGRFLPGLGLLPPT